MMYDLKEMGALVYHFHEKYPKEYDVKWLEQNMISLYREAVRRKEIYERKRMA